MSPDTFTRADIPPAPTACQEGLDWLDAHWPQGRETWTVREALEAGCDLGHAIWTLAIREDNRRLLVAFACDCAERVLPLFEERCDDTRPRRAIETTRAWLRGEASIDDVKVVADDAADAAATYAARAAFYAAYAATTYTDYSADAAAKAANAAEARASAEREWQRVRLIEMLTP